MTALFGFITIVPDYNGIQVEEWGQSSSLSNVFVADAVIWLWV